MKNTYSRHRIAVAVVAAMLGTAGTPAGSAVVVTGPYFSNPGGAAFVSGLNLLLPSTEIWLGTGALASLSADAGSQVDLGSLYLGQSHSAMAQLDGTGTVLRLNSPGDKARLTIGAGSAASFSVTGGALLDGRHQAGNCLSSYRFCGSFIGDATGSSGDLLVSGAGSEVRLLGPLTLGNAGVGENGFGVAGGTATGQVQVLAGALMHSNEVNAGVTRATPGSNGQEHSVAAIAVDGSGSRWLVDNNAVNGSEARADFASGARATASLVVSNGGRFELQSDPGRNYGVRLGNGGSFSGSVTGTNSVLWLSGEANQGYFHMAESGGTAQLDVTGGGKIGGGRWVQVGLNGGAATLNLNGGSAEFSQAHVHVGNNGNGTLNISNSGRLDARLLATAVGTVSSTGVVTLDGAGSLTTLNGVDTHRLTVGNTGNGRLTVSGGALLDAAVDAAACAGRWCGASVGWLAGSTGHFTVTGAGSEARFLSDFNVGEIVVARPATDGWTGGELNGTTQARVEVLAGGRLVTEAFNVGGWLSTAQGGGERSFADVLVDGAGSTLLVTGSALSNRDANLNLARTRGAVSTLEISNGGLLRLQAPAGRNAAADLTAGRYAPGDPTAGGGSSVTTVHDAGSRFEINGDTSRLVVGNNAGGTALLRVLDGGAVAQSGGSWSYLNIGETSAVGRIEVLGGGQVSGARAVNVGSGGDGSLLVSGAGSLLTTDRNGSFVGQLNVGQQGQGRLDVLNGGMASAFSLQVGAGSDPSQNHGEALIDGSGTQVELDAVNWHRLAIRNGGVRVSGGALLDGTVNSAACSGGVWCGVFIANDAGNTGQLIVTDSGSTARFLSNFNLGQAHVTAPPTTSWSSGEPGATSIAQVHVLAGGRLETEQVYIAQGSSGPAANGDEGVLAQVRIKGPGSVWQVSGANGRAASFLSGLGNAANTLTDIQVADGGQLLLTADAGTAAFIQLGASGGINRMSISGTGSKLVYGTTSNAGLWIGRNGATASLSVGNGGAIEGVNRIQVGNNGALASFSVAGPTSSITYGSVFADLFIGRSGAVGTVDISAGAQVQMHANQFSRIAVGDNNGGATAAGQGSLTIRGAGTLVSMKSGLAGDANTFNPWVNIGWSSNGVLAIRDGAVLRLEGLAPTDASQFYEGAGVHIGNGWGATSNGRLEVSGPGSKLETLGTNPFITVGTGAFGSGHLSISNGASVQTTLMGIADFGAQGSAQIDNATLRLEGAWRTGCCIGASLSVGSGAGSSAHLTLNNGAQLLVGNSSGSERTNLSIGGIVGFSPGGSGIMNLAGGSTVSVTGSGGGGGQILVGATAGGVGITHIAGGSQMNANYIGVGALNGSDAGVGTLLVQDTSTVTADQIEIGAKGFVGGTGTLIGNVVNRGVFSPGNSPGTLHVQGSFANQTGGRLVLEVESDGQGGFVTDQLVFDAGSAVSLGSVQIEFRFLGATDPNAFQASGGFQIDSFLRQGNSGLDHELLDGASYSASSGAYQFTSFSFNAGSGAVFQAQAVPEPGTWLLWMAGLAAMGGLSRRRVAAR